MTMKWGMAAAGMALCAVASGLSTAAQAQTTTGSSFEVAVSLSPAAAARLAATRETVVVDVQFYGVPSSERERMADQGRLELAPEWKTEIAGAGVVRVPGPTFDRSKLKSVEGGQLDVSVDGYSGRHSGPDNILMCDDADDLSLKVAASGPVRLNCKLLTEM